MVISFIGGGNHSAQRNL